MKNFKKKPKISEEASILTKRAKSEKVVYAFAFVLFAFYAVSIIYPLLYLLINSFQDAYTYTQNRVMGNANPFALPEVWHFENYVKAINISVQDSQNNEVYMYMMFLNSIWYCGIAVCGQVFMSSVTGYVMAKYKFKAREFIYAIVIFSMTIPIVGTTGSMMKLVGDLGIYNSPLYVVVVSLGGLGFNLRRSGISRRRRAFYGIFQGNAPPNENSSHNARNSCFHRYLERLYDSAFVYSRLSYDRFGFIPHKRIGNA